MSIHSIRLQHNMQLKIIPLLDPYMKLPYLVLVAIDHPYLDYHKKHILFLLCILVKTFHEFQGIAIQYF